MCCDSAWDVLHWIVTLVVAFEYVYEGITKLNFWAFPGTKQADWVDTLETVGKDFTDILGFENHALGYTVVFGSLDVILAIAQCLLKKYILRMVAICIVIILMTSELIINLCTRHFAWCMVPTTGLACTICNLYLTKCEEQKRKEGKQYSQLPNEI